MERCEDQDSSVQDSQGTDTWMAEGQKGLEGEVDSLVNFRFDLWVKSVN